jgi:threonine/homoserine/homoserine lactone efflux protein
MAFLPQFINPAEPPLLQSLMVACIHFTVAMLYQCTLAAMVDKAGNWLQRPIVNRVFDTFTGSILLFIGLRLATDK